jgi:hypothetical protein
MNRENAATIDRPRRLPVQVHLQPGEHMDSFVRRLAIANHLRPSYLRTYLNQPPGAIGAVQVERLALVTGQAAQTLTRVLTGAKPATPNRATTSGQHHGPDGDDLGAAIRRTAAHDPLVLALSRLFAVPRRTIVQALTRQEPRRARHLRTIPCMEPYSDDLDALIAANPEASIWTIWKKLLERHPDAVCYASTRYYVNRARAQTADTRFAQFRMTRAQLFTLIRQEANGDDLVARLTNLFAVEHSAVSQALNSEISLPRLPQNTTQNPILAQLRPHIDAMIATEPDIPISDIWTHLVDNHHADVSYATVRSYVARVHRSPRQRRTLPPAKPDPGQVE